MDRKQKILKHINKNGQGLEIAPSCNPIAPKREGYRVHIIDRLSREQLRDKYRSMASQIENTFSLSYQMRKLEKVDFIWKGESYCELTGRRKFYDWIIACHVIEHAPDLIGFLNDCAEIMQDDAVISLVIADKRSRFDRFRPVSCLSNIIDAHFMKTKVQTAGSAAEYTPNPVAKDAQLMWDKHSTGGDKFIYSLQGALEGVTKIGEEQFLEVHSWCFTLHTFRLMVHNLFCLGFIPFREVGFFPTEGGEFFITLARNGKGIAESRRELRTKIESELSEMPLRRLEPAARVSVLARLLNHLKRRFYPYEMRRRTAPAQKLFADI
jgi:hypothetical protein